MRKQIIAGVGLSCMALSGYGQSSERPNIVFILADDMGWTALTERMDQNIPGSCSDYYQTPNIDRIVRNGIRFSHGYAPSSVSSPSRHSIQTGMNPSHINHVYVGQKTTHIKYGELFSIPKMLKEIDSRYVCAHFGKWHLDCDPAVMGYDQSVGMTKNTDGDVKVYKHIPYEGDIEKAGSWLDIKFSEDPKLAFSLTEKSVKFLEECAQKDVPFYLQLSHYATHKEIISTEESYNRFNALPRGKYHDMPTYAAMLYDMDRSIGILLDKLEELDLLSNTYIFFMTDNGGVPFFPPARPERELLKGMGSNSPLQRGKWDVFEGGLRVPFVMAGPGITPGSQCDVPVIGYDWLPTVAEIAGYNKPLPEQIDGCSFLALAKGQETSRPERSFPFYFPSQSPAGLNRPQAAIIRGDYKLIEFLDNDEILLFNLRNDLSEQTNLAGKEVEKAAELKKELDDYHALTKPIIWDPELAKKKAEAKKAKAQK